MGTRPPFLGAVLLYLSSLGFMSTGLILEVLVNTHDAVSGATPYKVREIVTSRGAGTVGGCAPDSGLLPRQ